MYEDEDDYMTPIAEAYFDYTNRGFTMELPKDVHGRLLSNGLYYLHPSVSVTDRNTLIFELDAFYCFNQNKELIGYIMCDNSTEDESLWVFWLYADRNVKIKGDIGDQYYNEKFDLTLNKGWNQVYDYTRDYYVNGHYYYQTIYSNVKPAEMDLFWNFDPGTKLTNNKQRRLNRSLFPIKKN